jgi:hypothetical protein
VTAGLDDGVDATGKPVTLEATPRTTGMAWGTTRATKTTCTTPGFVKLAKCASGGRAAVAVPLSAYRLNVALVGRNLLTHSNAPNIDP